MKGAEQVRVFLKGRQVDAAGEESRITLSVIGRRFLRGESRYVSYDDAELIEGAIVPTILRIGADDVRLQRRGVVRCTQNFVPGQERRGDYRTPYGRFSLSTLTRRLRVRSFPDGVEMSTSSPSPVIFVAVCAVSMLLSSEIALCAISSNDSTGMPIII